MPKPKRVQFILDGLGGPEPAPRVRRVRKGVDAQIKAQRGLGHLETIDEALVALARTLGDEIDDAHEDEAPYAVAALAGRLVPLLLELRGGSRDGGGDEYDVELGRLRSEILDAARPGPSVDGTPD